MSDDTAYLQGLIDRGKQRERTVWMRVLGALFAVRCRACGKACWGFGGRRTLLSFRRHEGQEHPGA